MKLILEIRTKQMRFLGHLMRKDGLENLVLTGKIEGRRSRGRQWPLWMANLNEWIRERGVKYQEVALFEKARDRELWKSMISLDMAHRETYTLLNKRLQYLHKLLQNFRSKNLAMINKDRNFCQYNSGDLVYIISLLTSQLQTSSRKVATKDVGLW